MKVQDIGTAISKRLWIVIALVIVAALVAAIVAQVQSPVYKVEILLAASPPKNPTTKLPDATVGIAYTAAMPSIANYCESMEVAETVSQYLSGLPQGERIDISPEELVGKVSAVPESNSNAVKITFTDGDANRVARIANAWGEVLVQKTLRVEGNEYYDASFQEVLLGGIMVFTNPAIPPEKPTQPKPLVYLGLGVFIGLVLGLALVVGIEYFNPHFRSPSEVEEILDLPVIGVVPKLRGNQNTALLNTLGDQSISWPLYSEIRSSIILSLEESDTKTILVAPAIPFEAGPTVAANMAISIANTGRKTLLVDADMRDQALSELMGAQEKPGLSDSLKRGDGLVSQVTRSEVDNLDLLPSGEPTNVSTDLLSMPQFEEQIDELEDLYDKVLLFGPPVAISIDAVVAASKAQASLMIIDSDRCTRSAATEALHAFDRVGIKPMGIILANVKIKGKERSRLAPVEKAPAKKAPPKAKEKEIKPRVAKKPAPEVKAPAEETTGKAEKKSAVPPVSRQPSAEREGARIPAKAAAGVGQPQKRTEEEAQQINAVVSDDFHRLGERGEPIPKHWLRALNSDKTDVRQSAETAITSYYHAFLQRYGIGEDSVERITASIIKMMRREGEFAHMGEEEAQRYLQQMLVDAGARFSGSPAAKTAPRPSEGEAGGTGEKADKVRRRSERRRLDKES